MPSERYKKILEENAVFELMAPYNFCDRWCERCPHQTQERCSLYQDEQECKLTCIAHGREEDDWEVTEQVLDWQYAPVEKMMEERMEEFDLEDIEESELEAFQEHTLAVDDDPFSKTADQYRKKARAFLEMTFYKHLNDSPESLHPNTPDGKGFSVSSAGPGHEADSLPEALRDTGSISSLSVNADPSANPDSNSGSVFDESSIEWSKELISDFEIVAWYHTLLPVKLQRALASFYESSEDENISLCDAVAQFAVCKKAAALSLQALRRITRFFPTHNSLVGELTALLQNISSRIEILEDEI